MKQLNGVAKLSKETEEMRMQVVDLELKARYWKAQFEIRDYTLRAEGIQPAYNEYLEAQKVKQEELLADFKKSLEGLKKADDEVLPENLDEVEKIVIENE